MGRNDIGLIGQSDLLAAFEDGTLPPNAFPHERHLEVTALLLARYERDEAYARLVAGIRRIAAKAGRPEKFHETITRAWFELVALAQDTIDAHPELLDRSFLSQFYSPEALAAGREAWVEPDLAPLRL